MSELAKIDLMVHSAQVCTAAYSTSDKSPYLKIISDGSVAVNDGLILDIGTSQEMRSRYQANQEIDAQGMVLTPGLVDPHTHIPWVGDRVDEFEMRVSGRSYMDIMESGGGIMSTVRAVREASVDQIVEENLSLLNRLLAHGTTTVEMKSGYGLNTKDEIKQLDAMLRLSQEHPINVAMTFLGAHAVPAEYQGNTEGYVDFLLNETLPSVADWAQVNTVNLFCDVFCEVGAFNMEQSRRILERAFDLGMKLKMHADEFKSLGGASLACKLGATSVDHLASTGEDDIHVIGESHTVAVSLPGTPFGLGHNHYTPARDIINAGGKLAIASDLNPGTCWCESMQFIMALAARYLRLTPEEALLAATTHAAAAILMQDQAGMLAPSYPADMVLWSIPDYRHLCYRFGTNQVHTVFKDGRRFTPSDLLT